MGWLGEKKSFDERGAHGPVEAICYPDRPPCPVCSARAATISPADRSQHSSHSGERADKQQHGQSNHQEKCRPHIVQNRGHTTSLLLLDASTAPSTDTDPWTHGIDFLKRSPATRTLPSPHLPHRLANPSSCPPRFLSAISEKPAHGITLSPVKCRSRLALGPRRFPLGPTSTCPQPIVNAGEPWNALGVATEIHHPTDLFDDIADNLNLMKSTPNRTLHRQTRENQGKISATLLPRGDRYTL